MTNTATKKSQRVRFEEVTPTHEIVAYFNAQLPALLASTGLPIFPGYDDLDYIQFAYITLPSGNTVVLGQYENAPEIGVDLYVELDRKHNSNAIAANIPALVVETLRYLAIPREKAIWFHADYETEIERLYSQDVEFESISKISTEELTVSTDREPIDCFFHALEIYTRPKFPEHWAMLQHNLGLAYFDRIKDERWRNLQESIDCFHQSLEVFAQDKFPKKWQINQEDLNQSLEALKVERQKLVKDILDRSMPSRDLKGANLSRAFLRGVNLRDANLRGADIRDADLRGADLRGADLRGADLRDADLSYADLRDVNLRGADLNYANLSHADITDSDLSRANLTVVNLSNANLSGADLSYADLRDANLIDATKVDNAQFGYNQGISELMKGYLKARGAIFDDAPPGDRSESQTLVPR